MTSRRRFTSGEEPRRLLRRTRRRCRRRGETRDRHAVSLDADRRLAPPAGIPAAGPPRRPQRVAGPRRRCRGAPRGAVARGCIPLKSNARALAQKLPSALRRNVRRRGTDETLSTGHCGGHLRPCGCDPSFLVQLKVTVPHALQQAYDGGYPAEVSAQLSVPGNDGPRLSERLGHFCAPAGAQVAFLSVLGDRGCPQNATVEAWMTYSPNPCGRRGHLPGVGRHCRGPRPHAHHRAGRRDAAGSNDPQLRPLRRRQPSLRRTGNALRDGPQTERKQVTR
jgi:hypothetical protein